MFAVEASNKSFQRQFNFSSAIQPGAMHTIAGAIYVTAPNALETHQNVAANKGPPLFHFVGECIGRFGRQARDRSESPLVLRPIVRGEELCFVAKIDNSASEPFQISFRAATGGIAAADKTDSELLRRHLADCYPER